MHILIFNWKDRGHPYSGGAEIVTHEYAAHLVQLGHDVTLFCSQHKSLTNSQSIEKVKIVRRGNFISVYLHAFLFYFRHRKIFDIVIDQIHGIPFFTPLFVRAPILAWIHEVADRIWDYEWTKPIAVLGRFTESLYLKLYSNIPFLTDTKSTKQELSSHGVKKENITVIPLTIAPVFIKKVPKSTTPQLIYVGRLSPMKRVDLLFRAVFLIQKHIPSLKVVIVGSGKSNYTKKLIKLVDDLQLTQVKFMGKTSEAKKYELLSISWLHIQPSVKEGFGLTVLEAAKVGTPTVGFKVCGLKDQIKDGINGILVERQTPEAFASIIIDTVKNKQKLSQLSKKALSWSHTFPTWEEQTIKLEKLLHRLMKY